MAPRSQAPRGAALSATTAGTTGLVLVEHERAVPLDHDRPDGRDPPFLLLLQGGPGHRA